MTPSPQPGPTDSPIAIYEVPEKDNSPQEREKKNTNIIRTKTTSNSNETGQVTLKFGNKPGKLNPPPGSTPTNKSKPNKTTTNSQGKTKPQDIPLILIDDDETTTQKNRQ